MPAHEQHDAQDIEIELHYVPSSGKYLMTIIREPMPKNSKAFSTGQIEQNEILTKLDEFLELLASE